LDSTIDLLSSIDERVDLTGCTDRLVRFMVASCRLITHRLPDVAKSGLEVAARHREGHATNAELEAARVACWQDLDAKSWSTNTHEPEACATRAVICLLYPRSDNIDVFEHVAWFVQMVNAAEAHDAEQYHLLQQAFSDILSVG
jgi:hypothetical protein